MQMDEAFIKDVVDRAAMLLASKGPAAYSELRDQTGPFMFMDTYVFVDTADGIEVVNGAQPSMEGTSLKGLTDVNGKKVADEYIAAAMRDVSAWVDYYWYRPGDHTPSRKQTYVRKVLFGNDTYIVGSGFYVKQGGGPS
jgi:signal transduction histidine kinase